MTAKAAGGCAPDFRHFRSCSSTGLYLLTPSHPLTRALETTSDPQTTLYKCIHKGDRKTATADKRCVFSDHGGEIRTSGGKNRDYDRWCCWKVYVVMLYFESFIRSSITTSNANTVKQQPSLQVLPCTPRTHKVQFSCAGYQHLKWGGQTHLGTRWGQCSTSRPGRFSSVERPFGTQLIKCWVGPIVGMDVTEGIVLSSCQ